MRLVPCLPRWIALAVVLLASGPARADLAQAVDAFNAGEFRRSLTLLKQAAPAVHDPRGLGRLELYTGLNHAFLGQTARARRSFRAALDHDPTLEVDPVRIRPDVVQLFQSVRGEMTGELVVGSRMPSAVVVVDGVEQGQAPLRLRLTVGRHGLEVLDRRGMPRHRGDVVIYDGKVTSVEVRGTAGPGGGTGALFKVRPARPRRTRRAEDLGAGSAGRRRLWTWVAGGGAVVAGAIGLGLVLSGASDHEEYMTTYDCGRLAELEEAIPRKYTAGYVMLGLAGAAAVAAGVLYFAEGRPSRATVHVGQGSAGLGFRF